jgi:hypothetical protein
MKHFLKHLDLTDFRDFIEILLFIAAVAVFAALGSGA